MYIKKNYIKIGLCQTLLFIVCSSTYPVLPSYADLTSSAGSLVKASALGFSLHLGSQTADFIFNKYRARTPLEVLQEKEQQLHTQARIDAHNRLQELEKHKNTAAKLEANIKALQQAQLSPLPTSLKIPLQLAEKQTLESLVALSQNLISHSAQ